MEKRKKKFGGFVKDLGKTWLEGTTSIAGYDMYDREDFNNPFFAKAQNIIEPYAETAAKVGASMLGGPAGGAAMSGIQSVVGGMQQRNEMERQRQEAIQEQETMRNALARMGQRRNINPINKRKKMINYRPQFAFGGEMGDPPYSEKDEGEMIGAPENRAIDIGRKSMRTSLLPMGDVDEDIDVPWWMWKSGGFYSKEWDNPRILAQSEVQPEVERFLGIPKDKFNRNFKQRGTDYLEELAKKNPKRYKVAKTSLGEPTLEVNMPTPGVGRTSKIEYEKGGKMLNQFEGPKHRDGGIDLNIAEVEGGETEYNPMDYVFSDVLKHPETKETFAEMSKKIDKKYGDRNNRFVNEAKRREYKELMEKQEEIRAGSREEKKEMQEGGFLSGEETGLDLMALLPTITTAGMTVADAISNPVDYKAPRMRASYEPQFISGEPFIRNVEEKFNQAQAAIRRGARTPGQYMSGMIQSAAEEAKSTGDIMAEIARLNRGERGKAEYYDYQRDLTNLQQATSEQEMKMRSEAARRNAIRAGMSQLATQAGQISSDIRREKARQEYQDRIFDMMENRFPDLNFNPETGWSFRARGSREGSFSGMGTDNMVSDPNYMFDVNPFFSTQDETPKPIQGSADPLNMPYNEAELNYENQFFNVP